MNENLILKIRKAAVLSAVLDRSEKHLKKYFKNSWSAYFLNNKSSIHRLDLIQYRDLSKCSFYGSNFANTIVFEDLLRHKVCLNLTVHVISQKTISQFYCTDSWATNRMARRGKYLYHNNSNRIKILKLVYSYASYREI